MSPIKDLSDIRRMPRLGEIRKDYEVGLGNKRVNCIWLTCLDCNKQRWVRISDTRKPNYTGLCHTCCLLRRNGRLEKAPQWKGGVKHRDGRILVRLPPSHPFHSMLDQAGYVERARLVMAEHLGRPLTSGEKVHHRNEAKDDDRYDNLRLYSGHSPHAHHHRRMEIRRNGNRPRDAMGRFLKGGYYEPDKGYIGN